MEENFLTTSELCEWLRISHTTAGRWRKEGMPYFGQGKSLRYEKSKVIEWLERRKEEQK